MNIGDTWNGYTIESLIGQGAYGKVYKIVKHEFGFDYEFALKVIQIPKNVTEYNNIRLSVMSDEGVTKYFSGVVEDIVSEFAIMYKLEGNNIVNYKDHSVRKLEDTFGWEVCLRMELLTPILVYLYDHTLSIGDVIKMGIDICKALEICQKYNVIHRDIKPENILISEMGDYKLGDFGISKILGDATSGMSKKGTELYMAPEIYNGNKYNSNVDIYSLGIVMYYFLNNNRIPFLSPTAQGIRYNDTRNAIDRRMRGDELPTPYNAKGRLAEIILKACSFDPKERYESAKEMREALEAIRYSEDESKIIYPQGDKLNSIDDDLEEDKQKQEALNKTVSLFDLTPEEKARNSAVQKALILADKAQNRDISHYSSEDQKIIRDTIYQINTQVIKSSTSEEEINYLINRLDMSFVKAEADLKVIAYNKEKDRLQKEETEKQKKEEEERQKALQAENERQLKERKEKRNKLKKNPLIWISICVLVIIGIAIPIIHNARYTIVPDLKNMEKEEAISVIQDCGLEYEDKLDYSKKIKKGHVISQDIVGEKVKKGTLVKIVISRGKAVYVPNLKGLTKDKAKEKAKKEGFVLSITKKKYSDTVPKNCVISQDLKPKDKYEEGTTIKVTLSKGVEQVTVPDVKGKKIKKAKDILIKSGLTYEIKESYSDYAESGCVIKQSISANKKVDKGSLIVLTVSKGPEPRPVVTWNNNYNSGNNSSSSSGNGSSSNRSSSKKSSNKKSSSKGVWD